MAYIDIRESMGQHHTCRHREIGGQRFVIRLTCNAFKNYQFFIIRHAVHPPSVLFTHLHRRFQQRSPHRQNGYKSASQSQC